VTHLISPHPISSQPNSFRLNSVRREATQFAVTVTNHRVTAAHSVQTRGSKTNEDECLFDAGVRTYDACATQS